MILPGTAAIPAVHADRLRAAEATGAAAVELIGSQAARRTRSSRRSRSRTRCACCWRSAARPTRSSTSPRSPAAPASTSRSNSSTSCPTTTPVLVDLKPAGNGYMEDFFAAGGMGAVLRELQAAAAPRLHDGDRRDAGRAARAATPTPGSTARHPPRATSRSSRRAGWSRCSAPSRPQGAILKRSAADASAVRERGPGGGVRLARGPCRAHRRSRRST